MPPVATAPRHHLAALVVVGGFLGSAMRVGLTALFPAAGFPWATLVVNLTGSAAVGWTLPTLHSRSRRRRRVAFGAVGVAAAYTTFSTFTLDTFELIVSRSWATVTAYALLSIGGGVAVASLGHWLGERP